MNKNINVLKKVIVEAGWWVSDCEFYKNSKGWEIGKYSPASEDFFFAIEHNEDINTAIDEIIRFTNAFDTEEHIEMNIEAKRNGLSGVPNIKTLVKDADEIENMLYDLCEKIRICI